MSRRWQGLPTRADVAGIALALAVCAVAMTVSRLLPPTPYLSDILIALVLGVVISNTPLRRMIGLEVSGTEQEPDRYAPGLRYVGTWLLRLSIILMGLKVRTEFFHAEELALIFGVIVVALPGAFLIAHASAIWAGVRQPMADLLASGTMICGASAVNATAPVVGARRGEQGVAIAAVFLFSVVALLCYRPIAAALDLDSHHAGLWAGLSVNDLSSAIAVGAQMGDDGAVFAAASKSARVLMLAPMMVIFALLRGARRTAVPGAKKTSWLSAVPGYLMGYVAFAVLRALGDRVFAGSPGWATVLVVDQWAVDILLVAVAAGVGLHLEVRNVIASSARALLVGGATSVWMASSTLVMVVLITRGHHAAAALAGVVGLAVAYGLYRVARAGHAERRLVEARFAAGLPISLAEASQLLAARDAEGQGLDDAFSRQLLGQLHPTIGELIPARESPLAHGDGSRWMTYWQGPSGWALVAVLREPGSVTPIHAHPHRLIAKTIEGAIEELRFREEPGDHLVLESRHVLAHDELVAVDGLATVHLVKNVGVRETIDLQLRGPEVGQPGRQLDAVDGRDLMQLAVGDRFAVRACVDGRPGHGGDGAAAGKWAWQEPLS